MSPGYYRKLLLREWEKLAGNFLKQNNSKQNKGTSFMRGTFYLYSKSDRREGKSMNNMEQAMRKAVAALTGKKEPEVPAGSMEQICEFLAEQYKAPSGPAFTQVQAPAAAAGETPTKAEYDALVQKLKDAGIFK